VFFFLLGDEGGRISFSFAAAAAAAVTTDDFLLPGCKIGDSYLWHHDPLFSAALSALASCPGLLTLEKLPAVFIICRKATRGSHELI
jgi:hypothetical protein